MARASKRLISALRMTAARLARTETEYRWSHFAHCNCGHLTQTITGLSAASIYAAARRHPGDWGEQAATVRPMPFQPVPFQPLCAQDAAANELPRGAEVAVCDEGAWEPEDVGKCPVMDRSMNEIFGALSAWGLEPEDMGHLERLDDAVVRRHLGTNTIDFPHGDRQNVILYLLAWADVLEARLRTEGRSEPDSGSLLGDEELPIAAE
jgi:hypothetical protein